VQLCLSKGLGAPVGSVIVGPADFIWRARRMRKLLGGGMRQAGIIAAGGVYALKNMVDRLAEDHENAQILARGVAALPGVVLDPPQVETNIVVFNVGSAEHAQAIAGALEREGVLLSDFGAGRLRMVTHFGIGADECHRAVEALKKVRAVVQ
jgi:threonine aldolase